MGLAYSLPYYDITSSITKLIKHLKLVLTRQEQTLYSHTYLPVTS